MSWVKKLTRIIRDVVNEVLADVHTHLPAQIVSFDPVKNTVSIQPCIKRIRVDDPNNRISVNLPQIDDVPVHQFGSGKLLLTCELTPGSYGTYHVSERSITKWLNQGGVNTPDRMKKFDISDGFFIPGIYTLIEEDDEDIGIIQGGVEPDRIELRTRTRNTFMAVVNDENVEITASDEITFNSGTDFAVRFNQLETAFNDLKSDFNNLVAAYNLHVHVCAAPGLPSATPVYAPVPPGTPTPPVFVPVATTASVSNAKITEIRMPEYVPS